jgi:hypothetical protein
LQNYPSFWPVEHAKEVTYGPLTVEFVDQDKSNKHVSSKLFRIKKVSDVEKLVWGRVCNSSHTGVCSVVVA